MMLENFKKEPEMISSEWGRFRLYQADDFAYLVFEPSVEEDLSDRFPGLIFYVPRESSSAVSIIIKETLGASENKGLTTLLIQGLIVEELDKKGIELMGYEETQEEKEHDVVLEG